LNFLKEIYSKPLFKATSLNGISILIKIFIGFITSKIIAIFVGPSGMALVGNLRNFLTSTEAFATLGFENGVVKYVAEHQKEEQKLKQTLSTIFISVLTVCAFLSLVLFLFSDYLNQTVFGVQYQYAFVFKTLAIGLPFYIGNIFLIATINGLGEFKKVIYINIIGNCVGLLVSGVLIWQLKTQGALLSIIVTPSLLFLVSFLSINKEIKIFKAVNWKFYELRFLKDLSSYSLMALVSAVFGPMVFLAIRKILLRLSELNKQVFGKRLLEFHLIIFFLLPHLLVFIFFPNWL